MKRCPVKYKPYVLVKDPWWYCDSTRICSMDLKGQIIIEYHFPNSKVASNVKAGKVDEKM